MYASAVGASKILKLYLKALRKCEKVASQQTQRSFDESPTTEGPRVVGQPTQLTGVRERLWSVSGEDPLDLQNAHGNTARALALENGQSECANLLNEERLRRIKEMNKRLNSISHQKGPTSPLIRTAKKSAQKYMPHSSSFDSVYYDQEDKSDDDLMQARPAPSACAARRGRPPTPTAASVEIEQGDEEPKNLRYKKRFQSNPDLYRLRHSVSLEAPREEPAIEEDPGPVVHFGCDVEEPVASSTSSRRRQTVQGDLDTAMAPDQPRVQQPRKYSMYVPASTKPHQPIIGCPPSSGPSTAPKRNLTEKLMNFLRRRPKYLATANPADAGPVETPSPRNPPLTSRRSCGHSVIRTKPHSPSQKRSTSSFDDAAEGSGVRHEGEANDEERPEQHRIQSRTHSHSSMGSKAMLSQSQRRKPSPNAGMETTTPAIQALKEDAILKRRSVDLSFLTAFRNQFLSPKVDDPSIVGHTMIVPLSTPSPLATAAPASCLSEEYKMDSRGSHAGAVSNLPRLQNAGSTLQKRCRPGAEKGHEVSWAHEDPCDSGLASSVASSATGGSRPVSADSTTSHRVAPVGGLGRR